MRRRHAGLSNHLGSEVVETEERCREEACNPVKCSVHGILSGRSSFPFFSSQQGEEYCREEACVPVKRFGLEMHKTEESNRCLRLSRSRSVAVRGACSTFKSTKHWCSEFANIEERRHSSCSKSINRLGPKARTSPDWQGPRCERKFLQLLRD